MSDEPGAYDGYPDPVTQSQCTRCDRVFYHRAAALDCPYCPGETDVLNQGKGVVVHHPRESALESVRERLTEIESDNRLDYEPADVEVNAPLALIQTSLKAQRDTLRWVLDELTLEDDI